MSEKEKVSSAFDTITGYVKNMLGIKNEAVQEPEIEVEQPQEEVLEQEVIEVQEVETPLVEPEAEDTEAPQEPSEEVGPEIETSEEPIEQVAEDEHPVIDEQSEELEVPQEELVEDESEVGNEPPVEPEDSIVPEVSDSADLAKQLADMKAKIDALTQEKATIVAKAELLKEVENKFKGVPGKSEDIVDKIYNIKNSNLSDTEKEFILNGLSQLSKQNLEDCKELGHSQEEVVDENDTMSKAKALAKKESISEGEAILVLDGTKTLKQIKDKMKK